MPMSARTMRNKRTIANVIALQTTLPVLPPLPSLPLATGTRLAFHGDSQQNFSHANLVNLNNNASNDLGASSLSHGLVTQAHAIDPRFDISTWYDTADLMGRNLAGANNGLAGDHLINQTGSSLLGGGILPRLPFTLAHGGQIIFFEGGTNSIASGDTNGSSTPATAAYVIDKLDTALKLIRAAGKWCIFQTIYPRDDYPAGDVRYTTMDTVNAWIRAQAGRDGIVGIMDANAILAPGGVIDTSMYQVDAGSHVHLSPKGAFIVARDYLLPIIATCIAAGDAFSKDPKVNNLIPATVAALQGNTGTKAGGSGSVAANTKLARARGAGSFVAAAELISGTDWKQKFTFTSSGSDTLVNEFDFSLFPALTAANIAGGIMPAAGTWIRAHCQIELAAFASNVSLTWLVLKLLDSTQSNLEIAAVRGMYDSFAGYGLLPNTDNRTLWLSTPPLLVPATSFDSISLTQSTFIDGRIDPSVNPVVKISKPIVRLSTDPRVAWGY